MPRDLLDRHRSLRVLVLLVAGVLAVYLLNVTWDAIAHVSDVILLFFLAWIVAFVLDPVSLLLQRRGVPRALAVALIYIALLVVVSGGIVLAIPSLEEEVRLLASESTAALTGANLENLTANAIVALRHLGFSQQNARNVVDALSRQVPGWTEGLTNSLVNSTTTLFASILTVLFDTFLVLIVSFYMMLDGGRLSERLIAKLPPRWIPDVRLFQRYVEQIFGGFFRAQTIIAAIYAAITWIILLIVGQGNVLVAVIVGVLLLLPFIGNILCIIPPVVLVLLQAPADDHLLAKLAFVTLALIAAQNIVFQLIAPKIFGVHLGVHPLILFGALLIGAKLGSVWGAFFAGPIVGVAYAMLRVYYERFAKTSPLFAEAPRPPDTEVPTGQSRTADTAQNDGESTQTPLPDYMLDELSLPGSTTPRAK